MEDLIELNHSNIMGSRLTVFDIPTFLCIAPNFHVNGVCIVLILRNVRSAYKHKKITGLNELLKQYHLLYNFLFKNVNKN